MVVLADAEDRENEGDLLLAADFCTPEAINFMATHARGLVCVTLTEERCRQLGLPLMVSDNRSPMGTAFTVTIEAATGVSTGISAADRARTVRAASAIWVGVRYAAPMKPSAPASATAATSAGVSPPPASGACTIGWDSPRRSVSTVASGMAHLHRPACRAAADP